MHFRHPTDEQLGHVDIFFSNYYNLQSVYFKYIFALAVFYDFKVQTVFMHLEKSSNCCFAKIHWSQSHTFAFIIQLNQIRHNAR